jgi:hypothetical protein
MDLRLLRLFQEQVRLYCVGVLLAADRTSQAVEGLYDLRTDGAASMDRLWLSIHELLASASNVSKALWGTSRTPHEERQALRDSLGVRDDSPLKDPFMRHHFEHFDERLMTWWETSSTHSFVDQNVGPPGMISGIPEEDMFRSFDPSTALVVFWGQRHDLGAIVQAADDLLPIVSAEAAKPPWDRG